MKEKEHEDVLYIKMCEKAEEIQNLIDRFQLGDLLWRGKKYLYEVCVCDKVLYFKEDEVWLPSQKQLQDIVWSSSPEQLVQDFSRWCYRNHYYGIKIGKEFKLLENLGQLSMRQLWLLFVMKEKYNKIWDGKAWIKG